MDKEPDPVPVVVSPADSGYAHSGLLQEKEAVIPDSAPERLARRAGRVSRWAAGSPGLVQRILLPLIAVLLVLGVIEGGACGVLFLMGPPPEAGFQFREVWRHGENPFHVPDRRLFWTPVPGFREGEIAINASGFRGPDPATVKPADTFRVVLLGNSVTFGFRTREADSYAHRLAEQLQGLPLRHEDRACSRIEVINAGVVGYTSWQGRVLYEERIRELEPDLVIAAFGYNDHHSASECDRERQTSAVLDAVRKTGLFRLVHRLRSGPPADLQQAPVPRVSLQDYRENILAIQEAVRADGADGLFLTIAIRPGVPLVENFREVVIEGRRVWMRQIDVALGALGPGSREILSRHFHGGAALDGLADDPGLCRRIQQLSRQYPDLPVFPYLLASCLQSAGQNDAAREALRRVEGLDRERRELEAYNDVLRTLDREGRIEVLDVARHFEAHREAPLFMDVIHPTPAGHELIARVIAARIDEHYGVAE